MRVMTTFRLMALAATALACQARAGAGGPSRVEPRPGADTADPASNMGFRAEVTLAAVAGGSDREILALPLNLGTGDVADSSAAIPCSEPGAVRSDGVVDGLDLLCELWTSREGSLWLYRRIASPPSWQGRGIWRLPGGGFAHAGDWTDPIVSGEALSALVLAPPGASVTNRGVIVGSHDDAAPCPVIAAPPGEPALALLDVFYHTMFAEADDLLCGLRGRDWQDADGDGFPDRCDGGLFDPAFAGTVTVVDYAGGSLTSRGVRADAAAPNGLFFEGTSFPLTVTRGQVAILTPEQPPATWCQPHF